MSNCYDVLDVSRYVINYSNEKGYGISNLKLQKLLYFIQAFFLINKGDCCFEDKIEAWIFGPVVPRAYRRYKQYGSIDIPTQNTYWDFDDEFNLVEVEFGDYPFLDEDVSLIKEVVNQFKDYSANDLVSLTHKQDPWRNAFKKNKNAEIEPESIKEYFFNE